LKFIKGWHDLHLKDYKKANQILQNSQWFKTIKKLVGLIYFNKFVDSEYKGETMD
jgi:hypothetical protein